MPLSLKKEGDPDGMGMNPPSGLVLSEVSNQEETKLPPLGGTQKEQWSSWVGSLVGIEFQTYKMKNFLETGGSNGCLTPLLTLAL